MEGLDSVADDDALAVDDAHWLADDIVERIIDLAERTPTGVTRAPWPDSTPLRELEAALTILEPALRLEPLDDETLASTFGDDLGEAERAALLAATAGSPALTHLLIEAEVTLTEATHTDLAPHVVDAIVRRARAAGDDVLDATRVMVHGLDAATAAALIDSNRLERGHGDLERRLRASGMVAADHLIPVAATAVDADMTQADRHASIALASTAHDRLDPDARARLALAGASDPLDRARAAIHLGDPQADELVGALVDVNESHAARLAYALDMRAMRWERAAGRNIDPDDTDLLGLANTLGGITSPTDLATDVPGSVSEQVLFDTRQVVAAFASGTDAQVVARCTRVADDAGRAQVDLRAGWTPASMCAALMMQCGRPESARSVLRAAISDGLGGPGEQAAHHLLAALADVAIGEYSAALDLVRTGPQLGWAHRDHFLLAALDAAIARRSGDTARLRDAWRRAAPLVERQSSTWLLLDPTIEILAAGRRVGDGSVVNTALAQLDEQLTDWPVDGPAPAMLAWVRLQLAVAGEDWAGVRVSAQALRSTTSPDARSAARRGAAGVWATIATRFEQAAAPITDDGADDLDTVITSLVDVGDAWEASRLLGQLALDHDDPATARGLLERARLLVSDPVEATDGLIAAGLSEREAEVARLVAEGRAYKAIGTQLFISAKTVEHHVARIKTRLGASTRAEMLSLIREMSGDP